MAAFATREGAVDVFKGHALEEGAGVGDMLRICGEMEKGMRSRRNALEREVEKNDRAMRTGDKRLQPHFDKLMESVIYAVDGKGGEAGHAALIEAIRHSGVDSGRVTAGVFHDAKGIPYLAFGVLTDEGGKVLRGADGRLRRDENVGRYLEEGLRAKAPEILGELDALIIATKPLKEEAWALNETLRQLTKLRGDCARLQKQAAKLAEVRAKVEKKGKELADLPRRLEEAKAFPLRASAALALCEKAAGAEKRLAVAGQELRKVREGLEGIARHGKTVPKKLCTKHTSLQLQEEEKAGRVNEMRQELEGLAGAIRRELEGTGIGCENGISSIHRELQGRCEEADRFVRDCGQMRAEAENELEALRGEQLRLEQDQKAEEELRGRFLRLLGQLESALKEGGSAALFHYAP